ncbi:hypothetical protein, partial [Streptomyces sp. NPDC056670]|uniref:hypothetical protein n=1 Tax=Streptomyces sp. NPDC056670 TaxID=3345904 RepID=UPI0036885C42
MPFAAPRRQTCPNCSKEFLQPIRPGRPNTYCSAKCTAEGRHKAPDPPDHSQHDADLLDIAMDFHLIANALLADAYDNAGSPALLAHHAQLTRQLDHLEAVIVIAMDFHLIANALLADAYDNAGSPALLAHHAQL